MIIWKAIDVLVGFFALLILLGLIVGLVFPMWLGFLLLGVGVGLILRKRKDRSYYDAA